MHQFGIFPKFFRRAVTFPPDGSKPFCEGQLQTLHPNNRTRKIRGIDMHKTIQTALALVGITLGLAIAPAMAQSDGDSKMKMSKMSDKNKMMAAIRQKT